jgi:hypothetical protein
MDAARGGSRRRHRNPKRVASDDTKIQAWQKAKADADAVEFAALGSRHTVAVPASEKKYVQCVHTAAERGEHSRKEADLLDRIRSEENANQVGEAWLYIERHQKSPIDGQRVIRNLLDALTLSKNAASLSFDYRGSLKQLEGLKAAAAQLIEYFSDGIKREPLSMVVSRADDLIGETDHHKMIASLVRIEKFFKRRIESLSTAHNEMGLSREMKTKRAQYVAFTAALSESMLKIFGKPLDGAVQLLTEVALEGELTIDQVKHARRSVARRRGRTRAAKN